ncbi:YaiO family outer membrane beta-barrel protein [Persephonella sp.]|uniref:YaiO family outer membrane beta-barrel protein n=1 Tax=Persephonella sp. TaxID=2060922 RepID=UPI00262A703D|nr:YaiO family outer membrane beta-barrel protein [Persephonella sp.]
MKKIVFSTALLGIVTINSYALSPKSFEVQYNYERLDPYSDYGEWNSIDMMLYGKEGETWTPFVGGSVIDRKIEGSAALGVLGTYKDWTDWLYTYSSISFGTNSEYLPKYRLDHEFNFKLGPEQQYVLTAAGTYIKYWDVHKDIVLSLGGSIYYGKFIGTFRYFHNISKPGDVRSTSYLISLEYGAEKNQWTYLNVSWGKQAYLATNLSNPEEVRENSTIIGIGHRHWLNNTFGLIGELEYMRLEDSYNKYRISGGVFIDF